MPAIKEVKKRMAAWVNRHPTLLKAKRWGRLFGKYFQQGDINNNAIILAYYLLLSLPPMILILGSMLTYLKISVSTILAYITPVIPDNISSLVKPILISFLQNGSNESLSIGILITIWSASGLIATLRGCLNQIYETQNKQNPILVRFASFFLLLIALLVFITVMSLLLFGQYVFDLFKNQLGPSFSWLSQVFYAKNIILWFGMFVLLILLYYFIPKQKVSFKYIWIGALFASVSWLLLANGFQLYVDNFAKQISSYHTIGVFILLMFWLNFSSYIILIGAVINASCQDYLQHKK